MLSAKRGLRPSLLSCRTPFHAGLEALRFPSDPITALRHFAKVDEGLAPAAYWRGRAFEAAGRSLAAAVGSHLGKLGIRAHYLKSANMRVGTPSTHTWSHKDLAHNPYAKDLEKAEQEIEIVNSVVHIAAAGGKVAPFFRFPDLQTPPQLLSYFANRNIAIFSTHIDSRDFTMHKAEQVINSVMSQLEKRGKGIVLLHDFHRNTAAAMPELLRQLKAAGYTIVHFEPRENSARLLNTTRCSITGINYHPIIRGRRIMSFARSASKAKFNDSRSGQRCAPAWLNLIEAAGPALSVSLRRAARTRRTRLIAH